MSLLGKILLVVNLLAAGGVVYLATQDWQGRQAINASGLRHVLLIQGLPLEGPETFDPEGETKFEVEMAGGFKTSTVSKKLIEGYLQAAPGGDASTPASLAGGAVLTQLAEVKRVRAKVMDLLSKAESDAAKVALLKDWLLLQAETIDERLAYQALADADNAEELEKVLLARFDVVIAPPKAADAESKQLVEEGETDPVKLAEKIAQVAASRVAPLDEGERRARLAHLLVHLDRDAGWQKRVAVVVGLRRYVSAVAAQADRFQDMQTRLEKLIIYDQGIDLEITLPSGGKFTVVTGYYGQEAVLSQLARDRTELSNRQASLKKKWNDQKIKEDSFIGQRQTQLKALEDQLVKVKTEVDELLAKQANVEASLFLVQREVALTLDDVYRMEAELEARERELLGLPPRAPK